MNRTVQGILVGAGVGAAVTVVQTVRNEDDPVVLVLRQATKGAAQGAITGALVGFLADCRPGRRAGASAPATTG